LRVWRYTKMKKFIVLYYAPAESFAKMKNMSPEEHKKGMEPWIAWMEKVGDGLVDKGAPLGNGQEVTTEGSSPSKKEVAGYSILQAEDMDAAKALLKDHPHLAWAAGCSIEVYEVMPMPGE